MRDAAGKRGRAGTENRGNIYTKRDTDGILCKI